MTHTPHVIFNRDPASAPEAPLLVLFHGFGSNEQDLMGLAPHLPQELLIASVRAPQQQGPGFRWYPLYSDPDFSDDQVRDALAPLVDWLRELAAGRPSVTLLGFSQGMSVATSLARWMPGEITAVIGLSGFCIQTPLPEFRDEQLEQTPIPLFWGRDPQDPVIRQDLVDGTVEWAQTHADVTKVQYQHMGHSISPAELEHVVEYLQQKALGAGPQG